MFIAEINLYFNKSYNLDSKYRMFFFFRCILSLLFCQQPQSLDAYFEAQQDGIGLTSDRTLARLDTPCMDQETLAEVLKGTEVGYRKERKILYKDHQAQFNKWMFLLW